MSIHKKKHENGFLTQYIKGAPERILRICSHILIDGKAIPMSEVHQATFNRAYETMAGKGHRVLAFAQNLLEGSTFPEDYVFDKETKNFPTVRKIGRGARRNLNFQLTSFRPLRPNFALLV